MLGFEKDFSCHFHLGPIRILPLFPFPSAPFPRNEKEKYPRGKLHVIVYEWNMKNIN